MDRREWDRLAAEFESSVYDIVATDTHGVLRELVDLTRPRRTKDTLVDLGCGIGTFIKEFGERYAHVVGLDFSPVMVARASERLAALRNVDWIVSDIPRAARALADRGDLTVCLNVITSTSAAKRAAIWDALRTITKPGRHSLVVVPALESARLVAAVDERVTVGDGRSDRHVESGGSSQKYFTHGELVEVVPSHGLEIVRLERVHYPWSTALDGVGSRRRSSPFDWAILARRPDTN